MVTDSGTGGASGGNDGGSGGTGDEGGSGGTGGGDDKVSRADHQRALDDMHRFKTEAKKNKEQLDALQAETAASKAAKDQETGNFKNLWEAEKTARVAADEKADRMRTAVVQSERHRAVYPELKKAGFRDDAKNLLEKLDLSDIEVEFTTSGRISCLGVDTFVEKIKREHAYAFETKKAPRTNSGGGGGGGGNGTTKWTPESLFAFEQKCKANRDMAPYYAAHAEYIKDKQSG